MCAVQYDARALCVYIYIIVHYYTSVHERREQIIMYTLPAVCVCVCVCVKAGQVLKIFFARVKYYKLMDKI